MCVCVCVCVCMCVCVCVCIARLLQFGSAFIYYSLFVDSLSIITVYL